MDLSPKDWTALISTGGASAVLVVLVWLFLSDRLFTKASRDRDVKAMEDAKNREIALLSAAHAAEKTEYERRLAEQRDIINRNAGSQTVQANVVADTMSAMLQFMARLQTGQPGAPALPLPPAPQAAGPMP